MISSGGIRIVLSMVALVLAGAGCGGGSGGAPPAAADGASQDAATQQAEPDTAGSEDDGSEGAGSAAAAGPIDGLVTVQPTFGFGVFAVDRETGEATEVPPAPSIDVVDRNRDVVVAGSAAYSLGATTREGQSFSNDVSVVKIDLDTGQASNLASLGFDRETDDSETLTSYSLAAASTEAIVVRQSEFGQDAATYRVFDPATGEEVATFEGLEYTFESDTVSCSGDVAYMIGLGDGRIAGQALGVPAIVDVATGEIDLLIECDQDEQEIGDFVDPAAIDDYAVFNEGAAPTAEDIEWLLTLDLSPDQGFVEGDGDLWWVQAAPRSTGEVQAIVGGLVQFDLATESVEAVHPLGEHLGTYLECDQGTGSCTVETLSQAGLRYLDGLVVIVDRVENGPVLVLDPVTGTLTVTEIVRGDGVDYTETELRSGDPQAIWFEIKRMTITKDDDTGRSASGPRYLERFDPATGAIEVSIAVDDIF